MNFTPEQWTLIIGALCALLGAGGYFVRSIAKARYLEADARAKVAVLEAENEKDDTATQNNTIKLITDRFAKTDDLNSSLQKELRDCEVKSKEQDGTIKELRTMVHDLGEKNSVQAKMMRELAAEDNRKRQLIDVQEEKIRLLEYRLAYKIDDDPNKDKNILTEDDTPKDKPE
jgi:hypothetical protein